jgi:hypothetical protein
VIAYLEQLEQDLVEAIDRREATGERETRRRLTGVAHSAARLLAPRPAWLVAAALAVLVVAGVALVRSESRDEHPVRPAPIPEVTAAPPGDVTVSPELRISGDLSQVDATTWRGRASGPGGAGTLTLTEAPQIPADPGENPPNVSRKLRFRWDVPTGMLAGCVDATIIRRPHARWVWDGAGKVTTASGILEKYRGGQAGFGGRTMVSTPQKAYIAIGNGNTNDRRGASC